MVGKSLPVAARLLGESPRSAPFCPHPKTAFQNLKGSATITGVGFFDRPYGDGHALHGIELHPALSFKSTNCHFS